MPELRFRSVRPGGSILRSPWSYAFLGAILGLSLWFWPRSGEEKPVDSTQTTGTPLPLAPIGGPDNTSEPGPNQPEQPPKPADANVLSGLAKAELPAKPAERVVPATELDRAKAQAQQAEKRVRALEQERQQDQSRILELQAALAAKTAAEQPPSPTPPERILELLTPVLSH